MIKNPSEKSKKIIPGTIAIKDAAIPLIKEYFE
jgi:hypothetical protein